MIIRGHSGMKKSANLVISRNHKVGENITPDDFESDAKRLALVLHRNLPGGTFDRVLNHMMRLHMREVLDQQYKEVGY